MTAPLVNKNKRLTHRFRVVFVKLIVGPVVFVVGEIFILHVELDI